MRPDSRALVAYEAGRIITGTATSRLFDCQESERYDVVALAHDRGFWLVEDLSNGDPETRRKVYHYTGGFIYLNITGNLFMGYDEGGPGFFAGGASGNLVALFDRQDKRFFTYRLCRMAGREWLCDVCLSCGEKQERQTGALPPFI